MDEYWLRRPEPDERPGQPWEPGPGSLRAKVIAYWDTFDETERAMKATWRGRMLWRGAMMWARLRSLFR